MRTKKLSMYILVIFCYLSILSPCNATNPFEENRIDIPVAADNEATAQTDSVATDEALEKEGSLWEDLKKLYGTLGERSGKRIIKDRPRQDQEHHLEGYDDLEISIDGDNYCGQFAMSTLLNGMGIEIDPQEIYGQSNPAGIFTSPPTIVEHLRENGIDARMKNKATTTEIAKRIDSGKPVIVLVDSGDGVPHWVCITGYDTDENGKIVSFRMRDSYWGTRGPHTMDIEKFEKAWESPMGDGTLAQLVGYSNVLIDNYGTMDPETAPVFPGNFSTATEDNMASGVNDVVNGWMNKSVTKVISGATKLVVGLPGALLGAASNFADKNGERLIAWGEKQKAKGGVGNKILGEIASFGGRHASTVAKGGKVIADIWSSGASMIGNGIKKLGSLFS